MATGIGGYRDLPPGNIAGKNKDGTTRAPGEREPAIPSISKSGISITPEDRAAWPKALEVLRSFIQTVELYGDVWSPARILENPKLKKELQQKLKERYPNFPFGIFTDLLEALSIEPNIHVKK